MPEYAFPVLSPVAADGRVAPGYPYPDTGMQLRDFFAAAAATGLLAHPQCRAVTGDVAGAIAIEAYRVADAMMNERR